jgi:hypothetical protein
MSAATITRKLDRLEATLRPRQAAPSPLLEPLRQDPGLLLAGMAPDSWQRSLLCSTSRRLLLLCARQVGKSTTAAALALLAALLQAPALVLLLSPSLRQSGELFRKVMDHFKALQRPVPVALESALRLELTNGSRIISLPGTEETIRGYSGAALLVIDEAARVPDALYYSVRPMLAVSQGRLVCLSSPFGKRGWFYEAWCSSEPWHRVCIRADQCPRIPREFLKEERRAIGERWYRQEYECSFEETVDQVFSDADIQAALCDAEPLALSPDGGTQP